jgi:hypothetical protein
VKLAQCGDEMDDKVFKNEECLDAKVGEMKKAIHHVELNQRLSECFEILDEITVNYRTSN